MPYFTIFGIPEWLAWKLMPIIGTVDISLGIELHEHGDAEGPLDEPDMTPRHGDVGRRR